MLSYCLSYTWKWAVCLIDSLSDQCRVVRHPAVGVLLLNGHSPSGLGSVLYTLV